MAQSFAAILLVCLSTTPRDGCTEATASDVRSIVVESELGCMAGWQELIARAPAGDRSDSPVYLKTLCRRVEGEKP